MSFIDGHSDTIVKIYEKGGELYKNQGHLDIERLKALDEPVQFFGLWLNPKYYPEALPVILDIIEYYYRELEKNKDHIMPAYTYNDILENKANKKATAILALEGLYPIGRHPHLIDTMYRLGVRLSGLTWNYSNTTAAAINDNDTGKGLTELGFNIITRMNELGMIIDVSHLSERSFWDIAETSKKPFVATHSNAYEILAHDRNLRNGQIRAIGDAGGVIGINYYGNFISDDGNPTLEALLNHAEHIINTGGEDVIALGSDFDGIELAPPELFDVSGQKTLLEAVEAKFGSRIREKMAQDNMLRVIKEVWR